MATASHPSSMSINYLFLGSHSAAKAALIQCLYEKQELNDTAVILACSARLRGEQPYSPQWHQFARQYDGTLPQFTPEPTVYMDLPSVTGPTTWKEATSTIIATLKAFEQHKLFFMVRLECGRVESADIANIVAVMESIEQKNVPFSIIVYEVGKLQSMDLSVESEACKKISALMAYTMYETSRIIFSRALSEVANTQQKLDGLTRDMVNLIEKETPTVHTPSIRGQTISNGVFGETRSFIHDQQMLVPSGDLTEVNAEYFLLHKPEFESCEPAEVVHATLQRALKAQDADFTCHPNWAVSMNVSLETWSMR